MLELYAGTPPSYWQASYVYIYNKILTLFAAMDMDIHDVEVIKVVKRNSQLIRDSINKHNVTKSTLSNFI